MSEQISLAPIAELNPEAIAPLLSELAEADRHRIEPDQLLDRSTKLIKASGEFAVSHAMMIGGKPQGLISGFAVPDSLDPNPAFFINTLVIARKYQLRGYGGKLMNAVHKKWPGAMVVAVSFSNAVATAFYMSTGFERTRLVYWSKFLDESFLSDQPKTERGIDLKSGETEYWMTASFAQRYVGQATGSLLPCAGISLRAPEAANVVDCQVFRKEKAA